jgi:hypothetical protein
LTLDVGRFRDVLKGDQGSPEGPSAPPAAPAIVAPAPAPRPPAAPVSHRAATREKKPRR